MYHLILDTSICYHPRTIILIKLNESCTMWHKLAGSVLSLNGAATVYVGTLSIMKV